MVFIVNSIFLKKFDVIACCLFVFLFVVFFLLLFYNDEIPILHPHVNGKLTKSKRTLEFDGIPGKHFSIIYLPEHI